LFPVETMSRGDRSLRDDVPANGCGYHQHASAASRTIVLVLLAGKAPAVGATNNLWAADRRPVEPGQFAPALTILTPTISNPLAPFGPESDHPVDTARVAQGQLGMLVQHCRFGQPFAPPPSTDPNTDLSP
jgi:hypothetical protein